MDRLTRDQIEALYKRHHDRMLTIARTLLGNEDEARDVVSDVFAELLAKGKTPDEGQARNYLTVCVRNKCLNLLEHERIVKKSATELPADLEDAEYEEPPVDEVIDYIKSTGVTYYVGPCETAMEGDYELLMEIVKRCQYIAIEAGAPSVMSYVKITYKPDGEKLTIARKTNKHHVNDVIKDLKSA